MILVENGKVVGVRTATYQDMEQRLLLSLLGTALRGEISLEIQVFVRPNHSLASINLADNLKQ